MDWLDPEHSVSGHNMMRACLVVLKSVEGTVSCKEDPHFCYFHTEDKVYISRNLCLLRETRSTSDRFQPLPGCFLNDDYVQWVNILPVCVSDDLS